MYFSIILWYTSKEPIHKGFHYNWKCEGYNISVEIKVIVYRSQKGSTFILHTSVFEMSHVVQVFQESFFLNNSLQTLEGI